MRWLILVGARNLETNRQGQLALERRDMPMRGPQLQLGIAFGAKTCEVVVATREQIDPGERLRVAAVQSLGKSNDCRQHAHRRSKRAVQIAVPFV
jgi:hypothetical protein